MYDYEHQRKLLEKCIVLQAIRPEMKLQKVTGKLKHPERFGLVRT